MLDVLYPGRTVVLDSALSLAEVTTRLAKEVTPPANPFWDKRQQLFEGTFANGRFYMVRLVHGRHSFRPMLNGQLLPTATGTRIQMRMQLHPLVLAVGFVLACIAGTIASIAARETPVLGALPLLVQLLVIGLVALLFAALGTIEARKAIGMIEELLDAKTNRAQRVSEQPVMPQR